MSEQAAQLARGVPHHTGPQPRVAERFEQRLGLHPVIGALVEAERALEAVQHRRAERQALDALRRPVGLRARDADLGAERLGVLDPVELDDETPEAWCFAFVQRALRTKDPRRAANPVVLSGDVQITQGDLRLTAQRTTNLLQSLFEDSDPDETRAAELTARNPDYVGALIDAYAAR